MTMDLSDRTPPSGYTECVCCGLVIVSAWLCAHCHPDDRECPGPESCTGEDCDMSQTYHCFDAYCDGSGCTYPGECQGAPAPA